MSDNLTTTYFIPAQPDWYFVTLLGLDIDPRDRAVAVTEDDLVYEAIIAWELTRTEGDYDPALNRTGRWSLVQALPITATFGLPDDRDGMWAIKQPNDEFIFDSDTLPSMESLLKAWNKQRAKTESK